MIIQQQKKAATVLGVTSTALRHWQKEPGFPDCAEGYDIAAIRRWIETRQRKGSEESNKAREIKLALSVQKLRQEKIKADKSEREEQIAKGNLIPRDEYELAMIEQITMARDQILTLPKLLARLVPKKYHKKLLSEGDRKIRNVLEQLAKGFDRIKTEGPD